MPYDTNFPPNHQALASADWRDQLNVLNDLITDLPTAADVDYSIRAQSANNCDAVGLFTGTFSNPPTQAEMVAFKTWANALVTALHRS